MLTKRRERLCLMHLQDEVQEPTSNWGRSHWAKPDVGNVYEIVGDKDCEDSVCVRRKAPATEDADA